MLNEKEYKQFLDELNEIPMIAKALDDCGLIKYGAVRILLDKFKEE